MVIKGKKIKVECFTSNVCPNCKRAKFLLIKLIEEMGGEYFDLEFIDIVKNIDRSVAAGVLAAPSLLVNHQLVSSTMPGEKALRELLLKSLKDKHQ